MARDVVSPRSARVSATLVIARMILFTVLRVLAPLMVRSVLDLCTAKTLHPFSLAYSDFIDHTLPEIPSMVLALGSELCAAVLFAKPSFLPPPLADCSLFTIASYLVSAIDSFLPAPPIQFCVIGSGAGIRCGATRHRPTSSEVVDRLLRYFDGLALSFYRLIVSALSCKSSSIGGLVVCCLVLLFCFVFVFARSLWILHSFKTPLDEEGLRIITQVNATLVCARDKILAVLDRFERKMSIALVSVSLVRHLWKITTPSAMECTAAHLGLRPPGKPLPVWSRIWSMLVASPAVRYVLATPMTVGLLGGALYVVLCISAIWMAHRALLASAQLAEMGYERVSIQSIADGIATVELDVDAALAQAGEDAVLPSNDSIDATGVACISENHTVHSILTSEQDAPTVPSQTPNDPAGNTQPSNAALTTVQEHLPDDDPPCADNATPVMATTLCEAFPDDYYIHPSFHAKYELSRLLGAGSQGFVVEARRREDGREFAVKLVETACDSHVGRPWYTHSKHGRSPYEVMLMHIMGHDNIITLEEVFRDDTFVYIVQELHGTLCYPRDEDGELLWPNGNRSLNAYLLQNGPMTPRDAKYVFKQLVDAVLWCHERGISHCDIKPGNIVIDDNLKLKLIDFGCGILDIRVPRPWYTDPKIYGGTRVYNAPELHKGERYQPEKADIWSMGAVLYEMLTCKRAFSSADAVKEGLLSQMTLTEMANVAFFWPVIEGCLTKDPERRWSSRKLSKHSLLL